MPIQAVVVRTERELERAAKKGEKKARSRSGATPTPRRRTPVGRRGEGDHRACSWCATGVAKFVPVRTGIASETMIEVFGELKPGERWSPGPYKALRELKPEHKVKPEAAGGRRGKK